MISNVYRKEDFVYMKNNEYWGLYNRFANGAKVAPAPT